MSACIVTGSKYNGHIVSFDAEGINIGLDVNLGETIQSATIFIQYSKLLEILHGRFESVKSGIFNLIRHILSSFTNDLDILHNCLPGFPIVQKFSEVHS